MVFKYLAGPLVGALIGYCTNYLAVKMLFYPRTEIRIWGHKLPFTPGAIPKGKPRLAKAIGTIVGNTLITESDVERQLLNEETENAVVEQMMNVLSKDIKSNLSSFTTDEEKVEHIKRKLSDVLSEEIIDSVNRIQVGQIIARESSGIIKQKTANTMLKMFVTDELIESLTGPIGEEIERYIAENGKSFLEPEFQTKLTTLEEKSISELLVELEIDTEKQRQYVKELYRTLIHNGIGNVIRKINISAMIEEKINEMSIVELEDLVLSVMKKELDTIVNLGALIGFILGIINIFF